MKNTPESSKEIFLATTALDQFWDFSMPIVFLGEWCKLYKRKEVWRCLEAPTIQYPFDDREKLRTSIEYTDSLYEDLLQIVANHLNKLHSIDKNYRYWRIIIGPFLYIYIQILYDRYICLQDARATYPNLTTFGIKSSCYKTCLDAFEFHHLCRSSDAMNLQLYTQLTDKIGIHTICHDYAWPDWNQKKQVLPKSLKQSLFGLFDSLTNRGVKSQVALYLTLIRRKILAQIMVRSFFKAFPIKSMKVDIPQLRYPDQMARKGFKDLQGPDLFGTIILNTLETNFPLLYIEGFESIRRSVLTLISSTIPKAIITGVGPIHDMPFAVWAADCVDRGTELIGVQHGGTYGEMIPSHFEKYERSITDRYISWGWEDGKQVIPMPAAKLMGIGIRSAKEKVKEILWISTADSRYAIFFSMVPIGPNFLQYFRFQERFYDSLSKRIKSNLVLRLYPQDFMWSLKQRWSDKFPELSLDDMKDSIYKRVMNSRMVVIDHLGSTSFLEVLTLNKPVIVMGDNTLFTIRKDAEPYYKGLHKVNVLHFSPEEAAEIVNANYATIEKWWREPHRQNAVKKFAKRYAYTSSDGISKWAKFIRNLT